LKNRPPTLTASSAPPDVINGAAMCRETERKRPQPGEAGAFGLIASAGLRGGNA